MALTLIVSLCLCVILSAVGYAAASGVTDIEKHWAKEYIEYGIEKGYISGYPDNTFRPNNTVTRAEFSKMLNNAVKITGTASNSFSDVKKTEWYATEVDKAMYAAYIGGYEDGTFRPNNSITRQEAAVIFSRIMTPTASKVDLNTFKDERNVGDWAKEAVAAIVGKGYMKGDQNGNLLPTGNLTRAEAAKLICEFVKNENIVNGTVEIKKGQAVSQTIFTDDVVIDCTDSADVSFEDGRVLGKLEIKSGDVALSLGNTAVANVVNSSADDSVAVMADKDSKIVSLETGYPMFVSGENVGKVVLSGTNLQSGTVELEGDFESVEINGGAIVKHTGGNIDELNVNGGVVLVVQAGKVKKLNVAKEAAGAVITLSKGVEVDEAVNNAKVTYTGLGKIEKAQNLADGVTYETAPGSVTGNSSGNNSGNGSGTSDDNNFFTEVTVSPANKKTGVSTSTSITFTFDQAIKDKDGNKITADYVEDYVTLRKGSESGSKVTFTATVNTTKKITLKPKSELVDGTTYYIVIDAGVLSYADGSKNPKYSSYFKTSSDSDSSSSDGVTFSPKNKATDVSTDASIVISFSEKMLNSSGSSLTATYVEKNFEIRKGSSSGTKLSFEATVASSGKKVTLTADSDFLEGTKYYVIIPAETLENEDGEELAKQTIYFTTESDDDSSSSDGVTFSPKNGATKVDTDESIVITFDSKMYDSDGDSITASYVEKEVELRKKTSSGTEVSFDATVASSGKKITITPTKDLDEGTKYYVIIPSGTFKTSGGSKLAKQTVYFTTSGTSSSSDDDDDDGFSIDITPEDGSKNVVVMPEIEIAFSEVAVKTNGKALTDEYVEDDVVELRKSSKSGTKISFTASVSANSRKIFIVPNENLTVGTKYCLVINSKTLMGEDSEEKNSEVLSYFTVATATTPTVSPMSGSKNVAADTEVVISFSNGIYTKNDATTRADANYIVDNEIITLRRKTSAGTIIQCDVTVNSTGTTVTLTPDDDLALDYKYYVVIKGSKLYGDTKKAYSAVTSYFDTYQAMVPTFTPDDGDDDVEVDEALKIKFDEAVYNKDGGKITKSYLASDVIKLYKGTEKNGTEVEFSATISSDATTITVTPDDDLDGNTDYTLVLVGGSVMNDDEDLNATQKVTFTTENSVNKKVEFTPENKKTGVATNVHPTVTFKTKVLKDNGKEVDDKYATSSILLCKKTKSTSTAVGATVEVSDDGKTFTIIPDNALEEKTKYYIWVQADCFIYNDEETKVSTSNAYFTTVETMPELISAEAEEYDETSVTLSFSAKAEGRVYFELTPANGGKTITKSKSCSDSNKTLTVTGLEPDTRYSVSAYVIVSGIESDRIDFTFKTEKEESGDDNTDPGDGGSEDNGSDDGDNESGGSEDNGGSGEEQ